jgi:hypothetical protein
MITVTGGFPDPPCPYTMESHNAPDFFDRYAGLYHFTSTTVYEII